MKTNYKIIITTLSLLTAGFISLFMALAVMTYGYTSMFSRFILDDFCMGQTLVEKGFWPAQVWWYYNFIGRYSFTFFIHIFVGFGPRGARYMPVIALVVLILSIFFITYSITFKKFRGYKSTIASILAALTISFFTLFLAPEVTESFDWVVGMTTYFLPIVFFSLSVMVFSFIINLNLSKALRKVLLVLLAILIIINGGFSESFTVVMCTFWAIISAYFYFYVPKYPKHNLKLSLFCLIFSIFSLVLVVIAPGNNIRKSYFPKPQPPTIVASQSVNETVNFITSSVTKTKSAFILLLISAVVVSILIGKKLSAEKAALKFVQISGMAILLIFCSYVPPLYALSNLPPDRVLIIPMFILIMYIFISGYLLGSYLQTLSKISLVIISLLIFIVSLIISIKIPYSAQIKLQDNIVNKAAFAKGFDNLDNDIRYKVTTGQLDYIAQPIPFTNNHEATQLSDSTHWINKCIAGYYRLRSFRYAD